MSKIVMEGGTDVAEMVLFSTDEIPSERVSKKALAELESNNQAVRMPTGSDGGYLLHLYVDEQVPDAVRRYCINDDALRENFQTKSGQIAFGGAESTFAAFEPNNNIRTDSRIESGVYGAVAFRTDYPDELIDDAVAAVIGPEGKRAEDHATHIIIGTVVVALASLFLGGAISESPTLGVVLATMGVIMGRLWYKSHTGTDQYQKTDALRRDVQLQYPSIVIQLTKREP